MIVAHLHLTAVEFCQRLSPDVDSFVFLRNRCLCFIKSYGRRSLKFFCLRHLPLPSLPPPPLLGICLCVLRMQVYGCVRMLVRECVGLRSSCKCLPQLLFIYGSRVSPGYGACESQLIQLSSAQRILCFGWHYRQPPHLPDTYHGSRHPNCLMLAWQVLFPNVPSPQPTEAPYFVTMFQCIRRFSCVGVLPTLRCMSLYMVELASLSCPKITAASTA